MNKKRFPLIKIEGGYVAVNKEAPKVEGLKLLILQNEMLWGKKGQVCTLKKDYPNRGRCDVIGVSGIEYSAYCDLEFSIKGGSVVPIIAHTPDIPSLKDSGLPLIEIPDDLLGSLADEAATKVGWRKNSFEWVVRVEGYKDGYKAAGGYTEEDLHKMFAAGWLAYRDNKGYVVSEAIEKLKKHPVAVWPEMEYKDGWVQKLVEEAGYPIDLYIQPKVENGYVKVLEVEYEEI